jgi:hypothetical protein
VSSATWSHACAVIVVRRVQRFRRGDDDRAPVRRPETQHRHFSGWRLWQPRFPFDNCLPPFARQFGGIGDCSTADSGVRNPYKPGITFAITCCPSTCVPGRHEIASTTRCATASAATVTRFAPGAATASKWLLAFRAALLGFSRGVDVLLHERSSIWFLIGVWLPVAVQRGVACADTSTGGEWPAYRWHSVFSWIVARVCVYLDATARPHWKSAANIRRRAGPDGEMQNGSGRNLWRLRLTTTKSVITLRCKQ